MKKMRKMVLIIMAACMIATLGIATAQADWYFANVTGGGNGGTYTWVVLTDAQNTPPAFTNRWFIFEQTNAKMHLATALTAMSMGAKVQANFTGSGVPPGNTVIKAFYLDNGYN